MFYISFQAPVQPNFRNRVLEADLRWDLEEPWFRLVHLLLPPRPRLRDSGSIAPERRVLRYTDPSSTQREEIWEEADSTGCCPCIRQVKKVSPVIKCRSVHVLTTRLCAIFRSSQFFRCARTHFLRPQSETLSIALVTTSEKIPLNHYSGKQKSLPWR